MTRLFALSSLSLLAACGGPRIDCDEYGLDVPSVRGEISAGWDDRLDRMVFFSGNDEVPVNCASGATHYPQDTWEYSRTCNAFRQLEVDAEPDARGRHASASDGEKLYIHGGRWRESFGDPYRVYDDLWAFDYKTNEWEELSAGDGPSARSNHTMVLIDGKLWVYGGSTARDGLSFIPQEDIWTYDLETGEWDEVDQEGSDFPAPRLFHAAATDGSMMYVYSGANENAFFSPTFYGDLWAFDTQTLEWTVLNDREPGTGPVPFDRFRPSMEYDPLLDVLVMFGGHDSTDLGNTNEVYHYSISEGRWYDVRQGDIQNQPTNGFCDFPAEFVTVDIDSPERRYSHASVMTPDGEMLIFGGKTDCGLINDVWGYDPTSESWTEHSPATSGEVCPRNNASCSSICF
jgi:hypothetical protein